MSKGKRLIIIAIFLSFSFKYTYAQYAYGMNEVIYNYVNCNLSLYKSGEYTIELEENYVEDIFTMIPISYGNYVTINDTLFLKDKIADFEIVIIQKYNLFTVIKGLEWMVNKHFSYNYDLNDDKLNDKTYSLLSSERNIDKRTNFKNLHPVEFALKYGIYNNVRGYNFEIKTDDKYSLKYSELLISEGKIRREGNILLLKDNGLITDFYMIISNQLPGITIDMKFGSNRK